MIFFRSSLFILLSSSIFFSNGREVDDSSAPVDRVRPTKTVSDSLGPRQVMVILKDDSVSQVRASLDRKTNRDETKAIVKNLKGKQDTLHDEIKARGGNVIQQYQHALNGIRVVISAEDEEEQLKSHPDVLDILPVGIYQRLNDKSVPFLGVPKIWNQLPPGLGLHGEGIKVGIIDSGIDYTHANFGGPGTVDAFNAAFATSTLAADSSLFGPNAPKVKGGYDFAGDYYDGTNVPSPDPNPLDCSFKGHGSHVAGTVGGFGVESDGTTYSGSYNESIYSSNTFLVGPGVAPKADLYAYRVFGCTGYTDLVVDAIDRAIADDVDVINMSLGADFDVWTANALAVKNAVGAGVIVVASAGNSGLIPYITGTPAAYDGAISVAAIDSIETYPGATFTTNDGTAITVLHSNDIAFDGGTTMTIKFLNSLGCDVGDFPSPMPPSTIVVVKRGVCGRVDKALNGQTAGAAAVVMINSPESGYPPYEGSVPGLTIPFFGALFSDTPKLQQYNGTTITLNNLVGGILNPLFRKKASFTSSGPRSGDSFLKPDIAAPGVDIFSTASGTGYEGVSYSGTSMACPHVAGVAALVKQAHPSWSVAEIKAAILSTANASGLFDFNPRFEGAGLVNALAATKTNVWMASDDISKKKTYGSTAVNFGYVEIASTVYTSDKKSVIVSNRGNTPVTFTITATNKAGVPHNIILATTKLTVKSKTNVTFGLKLTVPAATAGDSSGFYDASGLIVLTPVGNGNNGIALSVPYYIVPRAVSSIAASIKASSSSSNAYTVSVSNTKGPIASVQPVNLFAWGIHIDETVNSTYTTVRAVGVRSDFNSRLGGDSNDPLITFAINTHKRWSSPSLLSFAIFVDVDPQNDNGGDYVIFTEDLKWIFGDPYYVGELVTYVVSTRSRYFNSLYYETTLVTTDSSVVILSILSSFLCAPDEPCLDATTSPRFTYRVYSINLNTYKYESQPGSGSFNPFTPSLSFASSQVGPLGVKKSNSTTVQVDTTEFINTPALGVLVIAPDNKAGKDQALELPLPKVTSKATKSPNKKPKGK